MDDQHPFADRLARAIDMRIELLGSLYPGESFEILRRLPDLYRFLWRLAFDMEMAPSLRHYAASLAFYIFSSLDYISEETPAAEGYLDDLAVSVRGIAGVEEEIGAEKIAEHWRAPEPLAQVLESAQALLQRHLPERVEVRIVSYLDR
jgi:hypothetical protein